MRRPVMPILVKPWARALLALLVAAPLAATAQNNGAKQTPRTSQQKQGDRRTQSELSEAELRAFAVSVVISLANEARSYSDLALRPRVIARAAEALWDADSVSARALFRRAWEAAEIGDAEDVTLKLKDNPPAMVIGLKRLSGRDLRFEVLSVVARRDRGLAEEFFARLKTDNDRKLEESKNKQNANDSWTATDAAAKRLQVASRLLDDGQIERALEFAAPALDQVNEHSIGFLSELRKKNPTAADQTFALLQTRVENDPFADANTISGLSSYLFTPGLYLTFKPEGGVRWTQPDEPRVSSPVVPAALRDTFFHIAAKILLRPLPPRDQDPGLGIRNITSNVIRRLLPLFDQYAPETAATLRTQLIDLTRGSFRETHNTDSFTLTQGIKPEPSAQEAWQQMQEQLDRAKTSRERDQIYAAAAATLLTQDDVRARDVADKIEDPFRRAQIRQFVDFEFIRRAVRKKDVTEALRLTEIGVLTHTQRAFVYTEAAGLLFDTERQRALELLERAINEARRMDPEKPDASVLLARIAIQLFNVDRVRAWEVMGDLTTAANRSEEYNGENVLSFPLMTRSSVRFASIGGENFTLSSALRVFAKDDFYRALDLAKGLKHEAPRAYATLAVASAMLKEKKATATR